MNKEIPAIIFLKELNKKQDGYIEYNKEKSLKLFSNLDFRELNLKNLKNGREVTIIDSDGVHNISSSDFLHTIDGNTSYGANYIVFRNCKFEKLILGEISKNFVFEDCKIDKLQISNINAVNENNISSINVKKGFINKLEITNSTINYKLYFDELEIKEVGIINNAFIEEFSVKSSCIGTIIATNTDFHNLIEFHKVTFKNKFELTEIKYKALVFFDECAFNTKAIFEYIIFESFTHFRKSIFNSGLELEYTSNKEAMNFYAIKINDKSLISQETFRIIKQNFEVLGNKIEANTYHALELQKKHENAKWYSLDNIVLCFHKVSSNYSTNWLLAFFWIIIVGIVTNLGLENFIDDFQFEWINTFKYINITHYDECLKENPLILFFNKISLGYLYYQFLMSVRKDTRK